MIKFLFVLQALLIGLNISLTAVADPLKRAVVISSYQSEDFYNSVSGLLQKYVKNGQVDYRGLQREKPALDRLVQQIGQFKLSNAAASERKAFYINAYNILVLHQVLENYPIKSVMNVPGFFDKQKFRVAGEQLTLNELEKERLMLPFKDARIHLALVCAAKSCPPLLNTAYRPQEVEDQLQTQTNAALNNPQFIRVITKTKEAGVSEIFKWYADDFLVHSPSVISYINKYRSKPIPKGYTVRYYNYDWNLNDVSEK
ncbi:DUF547 domain-containing protein [Pontibacter locisalis]|uniref:DUF547 domain-containing protein n=1 Tax=Pontibacter locisalis TaxID=1719035 RepID=A0ABW5IQT3_9BACT